MKITRRTFLINAAVSAATVTVLGGCVSGSGDESGSDVTAIDTLLNPDGTLVQHAEAANRRLLSVFPKGFALDATHHPHISCLQRYVKTKDLDKVFDAVTKVLAGEKPADLEVDGVQVLLHSVERTRPGRYRDPAHR